jgi:hypothetical protein
MGNPSASTSGLIVKLNNATGLYPRSFISIVGVRGTKEVAAVNGAKFTIDSEANATASGAVLKYSSSPFKVLGVISRSGDSIKRCKLKTFCGL